MKGETNLHSVFGYIQKNNTFYGTLNGSHCLVIKFGLKHNSAEYYPK